MATYWENSCSFGLRYVSWYKHLIVSLFFFHLGFWSGNLFLIAPFPDLCLLVPFCICSSTKKIPSFKQKNWSSGKHVLAMNTPLTPLLYSKIGVYRGIFFILDRKSGGGSNRVLVKCSFFTAEKYLYIAWTCFPLQTEVLNKYRYLLFTKT